MSLATADSEGKPSVRIVLLKDYDADGFVFYTHAVSPKGMQISANPYASIMFYWAALDRQIRITGTVHMVSDAEADEYFNSRPYNSKLGAWIAPQSSVIKDRAFMDARMAELESKYSNAQAPRPQDWVGYRLRPDSIEFWQGRESRLHDRLLYTCAAGGSWKMQRLAP
jgi:pyridoxamine 5'-phosphate oxidase